MARRESGANRVRLQRFKFHVRVVFGRGPDRDRQLQPAIVKPVKYFVTRHVVQQHFDAAVGHEGFLGDCGALFVPKHRIKRGHQANRVLDVGEPALAIGLNLRAAIETPPFLMRELPNESPCPCSRWATTVDYMRDSPAALALQRTSLLWSAQRRSSQPMIFRVRKSHSVLELRVHDRREQNPEKNEPFRDSSMISKLHLPAQYEGRRQEVPPRIALRHAS
jgi:hypothetical protein